jgi:chromate transport protein ChrA
MQLHKYVGWMCGGTPGSVVAALVLCSYSFPKMKYVLAMCQYFTFVIPKAFEVVCCGGNTACVELV